MTTQPSADVQLVKEIPVIMRWIALPLMAWILRPKSDSKSWMDHFPEFAKTAFQLLAHKNLRIVIAILFVWAGIHYANSSVLEIRIMAIFPFLLGGYGAYSFFTNKT